MTHFLEHSGELKSPEYWDGIDIYDQDQLAAIPIKPDEWLSKRERKIPLFDLKVALAVINQGGNVDARYETGNHFNPSDDQLQDGSIVVIDKEYLKRKDYEGPDREWIWPLHENDIVTPPISRPVVDYWLNTRYVPEDHTKPPNSAGEEELAYPGENLRYSRMLWWGVAVSLEKDRRGIQPFGFNGDRDGQFRNHDVGMPVIPLPVNIGEVALSRLQLSPREGEEVGTRIDTLERIRGIDVVRFANNKRGGDDNKFRARVPRPRLALKPKLRLGNI